MNRIYEFPDGTIGATWMDMGAGGVPDRGTGYNFYNGTSWSGTVQHLGNDARDGFPNYAPWGANGELVEHYDYILNAGTIKILRRDIKGTGPWQEFVLNPPSGHSIVWGSMISSGSNHQYLHLLSYTYDNPYLGQDHALLYYRSPDGGVTWDINGVIIPGLDSSYFPSIAPLKYSWAQAVGNTIAFTYGFDQFDGLVFKSTDNGTTWTKKVVYRSPFNPKSLPDKTPLYGSGDGTSAIALDSQGKAHVVFAREKWFYDLTANPPGWFYQPLTTQGLIYWNESMPVLDSTSVSSYTLNNLAAGGNLIGYMIPSDTSVVIQETQANYAVGLTSMAQIGIDAGDKLFVVYSGLAPGYTDGTNFYRHLYGNASFDGGLTWNGIRDLNGDARFAFSECVYPAVSPLVDQKVRIVFQEDSIPGFGNGNDSYMEYFDFPKEFFSGIPSSGQLTGSHVSQNHPNPASQLTQFEVYSDKAEDVSITVTDLAGQVIQRHLNRRMNAGNNHVTIDVSGLTNGLYFYSVEVEGIKVTRKLMKW
jgi:hypothetical protein